MVVSGVSKSQADRLYEEFDGKLKALLHRSIEVD
jgi:hypothetical protein